MEPSWSLRATQSLNFLLLAQRILAPPGRRVSPQEIPMGADNIRLQLARGFERGNPLRKIILCDQGFAANQVGARIVEIDFDHFVREAQRVVGLFFLQVLLRQAKLCGQVERREPLELFRL